MRSRIFLKLLAALVAVIAVTGLAVDLSLRGLLERNLQEQAARDLSQKAQMLARRVESDRTHPLQDVIAQQGQAAGARVSVVDSHGRVLADSEQAGAPDEDLAQTPELAAALRGESATAIRASPGIGVPILYAAAPISGGALQLAYPLSDSAAAVALLNQRVLLACSIAALFAVFISGAGARSVGKRLATLVDVARQIRHGQLSARIADKSSDEIGMLAAVLNKTAGIVERRFADLRTSQHQLETLLNSMQDAVIAVSADDRVLWANHAMDRLAPQRVRLAQSVVESVRDPDFLAAVHAAADSHGVVNARATSILPGRTFDVTAAPMPGGGIVAVLHDLTETERVEKTRRDFIANVSHELRTPLTSIQGFTETLLDLKNGSDNSARDFLEIIRKNATRMSRLTEDLLTLARVESGETRFDPQPLTPEELLREAMQSFTEITRTHGLELQLEAAPHSEVKADREAIHQVFTNLIDNAMKYGGTGGRIVLGARDSEIGVEFYVRDFGQGISSEHLPRLFERFYRVDKARSRESGGTGLGLAIAKHIVLAHGGAIRAESDLNHGAMFLFTLPYASEPAPSS